MTYPGNFKRLVVSGSGDGGERWSWSLATQVFDNDAEEPNVDAVPAALITAVTDFHKSTSSPRAKLDSIKYNEIGIDGKYVRNLTVEKTYLAAAAIAGAGGGGTMPAQVALAVTLNTDVDRGLAKKGRFYIPYPPGAITATGYLSDAATDTVAQYARKLVDDVNAAVQGSVIVASNVRTGAFRRVMSVSVGNRFDIIRSRGASLRETYATYDVGSDAT